MKKKRVFIALKTSIALRKQITVWRNSHQNLPIRWLSAKNLHCTLVSPWYSTNPSKTIKKLISLAGLPSAFTLNFETIEFGPKPGNFRLIWARGERPVKLILLKDKIERALNKKTEKRSFKLHLTLARFQTKDFPSFPVKKLSEKISWQEKINSFFLLESHLSSQGAVYKTLVEIKL